MNNSAIHKAATKAVSEAVIKNKLKELEVENVVKEEDVEVCEKNVKFDDDDDDEMVAKWREKRAEELKKMKNELREYIENGHGQLHRVGNESEIIKLSKTTERIVCHLSEDDFLMCQTMENALKQLANKHIETKFVSIEAIKAPFFTERLSIRILPTVICILNGKIVEIIIGFDRIGGVKLDLDLLSQLLASHEMIKNLD